MRVPHLTDLLTWEEIWACQDVYRSGQGGGFGPIRLRLPDEISGCGDKANGKSYHVERYSAKARYAKELLRLAETAVCAATGAESERVEWVPASVSFNTIRYPNLDAGAYVQDVMREMERLADAGTLSVQTGIKCLGTLKAADGEEREQLEIVFPEFNRQAAGSQLEELMKPGAVQEEVFTFRWADMSDSFAVLSPMQVAFLHEEQMHRHTALDDELFHACGARDEAGIRAVLEKGANIHALDSAGESVCATVVEQFNRVAREMEERKAKGVPETVEHADIPYRAVFARTLKRMALHEERVRVLRSFTTASTSNLPRSSANETSPMEGELTMPPGDSRAGEGKMLTRSQQFARWGCFPLWGVI